MWKILVCGYYLSLSKLTSLGDIALPLVQLLSIYKYIIKENRLFSSSNV